MTEKFDYSKAFSWNTGRFTEQEQAILNSKKSAIEVGDDC